MQKSILGFVSLILLVGIGCTEKSQKKRLESDFGQAFIKVVDIRLDSNTVFDIRYLDVDTEGKLLVTNRRRSEVFLYDSTGTLITRLSSELDNGFPGGNWMPLRAYFKKNGHIFVANRVPWGIEFDENGRFIKFMPEEYRGGDDLAFDEQGNIYSLNKDYRGQFISRFNPEGKGEFLIEDIDTTFSTIVNRSIIGRNLLVNGGYLFHKNMAKPAIYKFKLDGAPVTSYFEIPGYYKTPATDIRINYTGNDLDKAGLQASVFDFAKKYTANYSMHALTDRLILVQYVNMGGKYGCQILTTDGEYVLDYDLYTEKKIYAARNGFVYVIEAAQELPISISKYRFRNPGL